MAREVPADVKAKVLGVTLGDLKASVARFAAGALLDDVDLAPGWQEQLEAASTSEQVLVVREGILRAIADRNRAEAEEYRRTGVVPERIASGRGSDR